MNDSLKQSLCTVTRLSKFLAMALFIILPFIGLYIGYMFAPERMVEVERVVEVEKIVEIPKAANDKIKGDISKTYKVAETVTLDMSPFDSRTLTFEIGSSRYAASPFLTDHLDFDAEKGEVLLMNYALDNSEYRHTEVVLKVNSYSDSNDLEKQLEDLYVSANERQFTVTDVDIWRHRCSLHDENLWLVDETIEQYEFGWSCVSGSFEIIDDLLFYNPAYPSDAMEPKVRRNSIILNANQ